MVDVIDLAAPALGIVSDSWLIFMLLSVTLAFSETLLELFDLIAKKIALIV